MKKGILLLVLLIALLLPLANAAINETVEKQVVGKSQVWLDEKVKSNLNLISSDELSLSMLALSYDSAILTDGKEALIKKSKNSQCWPSSSCDVKSTALAVLAINSLGENTDEATDWIMGRKSTYTTSGIKWLLQIDSESATNCTIYYDSNTYNINLNDNRTYSWSGKSSPCLTITNNGYWLEIVNTKDCLGKAYDISCTNSAIASLPYNSGGTLFVPSESFQTPSSISINAVCIGKGTSCDYEDTLWAAYALQKSDKDYSIFIPYLLDQRENNLKYLPDALLYTLTSRSDYADNLLALQSKDGYWSAVGGLGKYYDTALAYNSLINFAESNATKAKEWLIKENNDGKWGTTAEIRDTAMVLAFVWPSQEAILPSNDCEDVYNLNCRASCFDDEETATYSCGLKQDVVCCQPTGFEVQCTALADCRKTECNAEYVTDARGNRGRCEQTELNCNDDFDNDADGKIDYSDSDCSETCADKGGRRCESGESCSGQKVNSFDISDCCLGECVSGSEATCAEQNGIECFDNQKCENDAYTPASDTLNCCTTTCKSKTSLLPFIILAIILALGAAGFFLYKKGFFKKIIVSKKVIPGMPPQTGYYRPAVKPLSPEMSQERQPVNINLKFQPQQHNQSRPQYQPVRKESKELDETLKKLKKLAEK